MIYSWKKIVAHGLPLLLVCVIIEIFAGQVLLSNPRVLIPIFLISFPVINSVSGNIGSVLGARVASGLHVGYISISIKDEKMRESFFTAVLIGVFTYFVLGLFIFYFAGLVFDSSVGFLVYLLVFLGAGFLLVLIICFVSIFTAFISFKRGLDPDDVVAPVVTTIGDVFGIVFLFLLFNFFVL